MQLDLFTPSTPGPEQSVIVMGHTLYALSVAITGAVV